LKEPKYAVIYPLLSDHIDRLFGGKDIFCKYVGNKRPSLMEGNKIIFYASRGKFELVGEAVIRGIEFLSPSEIESKYKNRVFITSDELQTYRGQRPTEWKLIVLTLERLKKYAMPIRMAKYVTMAGQTLTKEEYDKLIRK
jgi:hypothetical protein